MLTLLSAFASYAVKFVVLIGVAVGGYCLGRKAKQLKKAKN